MKIAKEGFPFVLIPFALGAALVVLQGWFGWPWGAAAAGVALLLAALFCLFFFRDPEVRLTQGVGLALSPCNGTVMEVDESGAEANVVRVFLSIFNVHLQRSPVAGTVRAVEHRKGRFLMAMNPGAHLVNEQNVITIEGPQGVFVVKQIAGFLARRCVSWVAAGDALAAGEKIGLIKFSSQVDVFLPKDVEIRVKKGDKVVSGVSVFGATVGG
ncbi:MAG: phosphatidylserine decarboxylase [Spirochaetaceae bacterium]|jgi:phosphatidylserine decarboxylase|nr:phosphatidylserine decarboxylase [Spirochaetaceae bacterium]